MFSVRAIALRVPNASASRPSIRRSRDQRLKARSEPRSKPSRRSASTCFDGRWWPRSLKRFGSVVSTRRAGREAQASELHKARCPPCPVSCNAATFAAPPVKIFSRERYQADRRTPGDPFRHSGASRDRARTVKHETGRTEAQATRKPGLLDRRVSDIIELRCHAACIIAGRTHLSRCRAATVGIDHHAAAT